MNDHLGSSVLATENLSSVRESQQILGHDGKAWPETMDGMAWAKAFSTQFPAVSVDDALGWFCNAIMRGYDTANWRRDEQERFNGMQGKEE